MKTINVVAVVAFAIAACIIAFRRPVAPKPVPLNSFVTKAATPTPKKNSEKVNVTYSLDTSVKP